MAVGTIAGLLAGVFGVGGGLVVVPMLIILLPHDLINPLWLTHTAVATSLASIVFTGSVSAWRHYRRGGVIGFFAAWLSGGVLIGAAFGAYLSQLIPAQKLQFMIVGFEVFIALRLLMPPSPAAGQSLRQVAGYLNLLVGLLIGVVSSWLGIGGGSMSVPYLRWVGLEMRQAVATSAAIGVPIAVAATVTFMAINPQQVIMPAYSLGFVYLPALLFVVLGSVVSAPIGVALAHRIPQLLLQRAFAIMLLLFALILIVRNTL